MTMTTDAPDGRKPGRIKNTLTVLFVAASIVAAVTAAGMVGVRMVRGVPPERLTSEGLTLLAEEDFIGPEGAPPDSNRFGYDLEGGGWGNNEKQVYTSDPENVRLSGTGQLIIEARRNRHAITSGRVVTRDKWRFDYGLVEARIKMPAGPGIHPAFWMLGYNISEVGYPACGEIDIMELVNTGTMWHNAVHGPLKAAPAQKWQRSHDGPAGTDLAADYHIYQVYRAPGTIKIGIDGVVVAEYTSRAVPAAARWVFDAPMYLTLNVAVGGDWPGDIDASTPFPAAMQVDWIRYWY